MLEIVLSANPASTVIDKTIIAAKTGNAIVCSPHPSAARRTLKAAEIIERRGLCGRCAGRRDRMDRCRCRCRDSGSSESRRVDFRSCDPAPTCRDRDDSSRREGSIDGIVSEIITRITNRIAKSVLTNQGDAFRFTGNPDWITLYGMIS